ncbi:helix-turn-helix domain-containing protein [Streptomyces smyrnaeus]|uniref:helix-turn-helix domain-containing protein n=1 Tax=Streptomyces smyrnaeus TaxID=1387713 RepID=UPI00339F7817
MTARTATRAAARPHKPQKQQKPHAMRADQQRSILGAASAQAPQKAAEPPHKCPHATSDSAEGLAALYFCGTSRAFCGAHPDNHNTPGQQPSSRDSADSAVSAAASGARHDETEDSMPLAVPQHLASVVPALYRVEDAMPVLNMGRTTIYELIRSGRLRTVKEGRSRLIPASAINEYVALLEREAGEAA